MLMNVIHHLGASTQFTDRYKRLELSMNSLTVFMDIAKDPVVKKFKRLLHSLARKKPDQEEILLSYFAFLNSLAENSWRDYLVETLLRTANFFAEAVAEKDVTKISLSLQTKAGRDMEIIQEAAGLSSQEIIEYVKASLAEQFSDRQNQIFEGHIYPENWPVWDNAINCDFQEQSKEAPAMRWLNKEKAALKREFLGASRWSSILDKLAAYYAKVGWGIFSKYMVFHFNEQTAGKLEGIAKPDPVILNQLIAQEREQKIILDNTEYFLRGYRANNIILYGNRGTGKSSLVKALQNEYPDRKLRIVQLKKNQIGYFPEFVQLLAGFPYKFIVFIDDLSFDNLEQDYKNLKSLLEGGVEARPDNVLIYATSNRRHLVRETFDERSGDEVHVQDNIEEKLSLADRFGITVTFLSPDQSSYLRIVEGLAEQEGISIPKEALRQKALQWVMMHNGRSGRTARQFLDHLQGELDIKKE
ncbi:protein of unknown function DUF815 [Syntrophobotulus glycolicus DSM 8271]|uniref:Uncharacterized protein n=1 Tax=Syntrophobotulus glycolicus (strain DSM 8271 / FlGlyR) TaxID=645991 RepID=F0SYY6_SYNGF|nr:ATP-binding protein [Syntrophobotulus glycolicus]ADY56023.1 protein of unknown function DUF815 [Syntrophobotulus glycolicus DSM 8271]